MRFVMDLQQHLFEHACSKNMDSESFRYPVLAYLTKVLNLFRDLVIYGHFSELIYAQKQLIKIRDLLEEIESSQTWSVVDLDKTTLQIVRDISSLSDSRHLFLKEQALWMLSEVSRVAYEGYATAEFVLRNLNVDHVGITPESLRSGYWILDSASEHCLWTYSYTVDSLYIARPSSPAERNYSIKTRCIAPRSKSEDRSSLKDSLIRKHTSSSLPMVYFVRSEFDAPLEETVIPITKRLLLNMVVTQSLQHPPP